MTTDQAVAKGFTLKQALDEGFVLESADGKPLSAAAADDAPAEAAGDAPLEEALAAGAVVRELPQAPAWFPLLFVTIACGAVSGFHSLVSSGTTVRQLNKETDALPIGYGAMLVEGVLAILVVMACAAGLGAEAWQGGHEYGSWSSMGGAGLAVQLSAVVQGGANFLKQLGIPPAFGSALLAVTIVAFAMTTLDTATRLLRFNVEELCRSLGMRFLANRFFASFVAVAAIAFFAVVLSSGGKVLWLMFGTTNQMLAGLTLLTVSVFLYKLRRPIIYTVIPMLLMLGISAYAMFGQLRSFFASDNWAMVVVTVVILGMAVWLIIESLLSFARGRGGLEFDQPSGEATAEAEQPVGSGD
jgi:carbon starvation protein